LLIRTIQFLRMLLVVAAAIFAFHAWQISNSDFVTRAERSAIAYSCIGDRLLTPPFQEYPAASLARRRRFDQISFAFGNGRAFSIWDRIDEVSTAFSFRLLYSDAELNRMRASLPLGPFSSFNDMSLRLFDAPFCGLSVRRQTLVARFERSSHFHRFRKLLLEAGELDAVARLQPLLRPSLK
jgi:hypothetical protein